ncbi:lipoyl(octanoyl) transferase LipB [Luteococcus sp. Sow4_B9]|uniref:lipoyl(octanoyl) transferase LipB n=1 Tax=Luteococcus sp. Sow4_B9 TaxID=3438792 RepID=UPI003F9702C5
MSVEFEYMGLCEGELIEYHQGWDRQRAVHARVADEEIPGQVILLEHQAVYTAGKQTLPEERPFDGTPVVDVDRGGKITWHGPGQLVGYPIIRLPDRVGVVDHVRRVEQAVIDLLAGYGVVAGRVPGRTGVWLPADDPATVPLVGPGEHHHKAGDTDRTGNFTLGGAGSVTPLVSPAPSMGSGAVSTAGSGGGARANRGRPERKICAIGIRVTRRTTLHGFSLNVSNASDGFDNIVPCGIPDAGVTSLAEETEGPVPSLLEVAERLEPLLASHLSREGNLKP